MRRFLPGVRPYQALILLLVVVSAMSCASSNDGDDHESANSATDDDGNDEDLDAYSDRMCPDGFDEDVEDDDPDDQPVVCAPIRSASFNCAADGVIDVEGASVRSIVPGPFGLTGSAMVYNPTDGRLYLAGVSGRLLKILSRPASDAEGEPWDEEVIDCRVSGADLAVDAAGSLHLVYFDRAADELAYATNRTGAWTKELIAPSRDFWTPDTLADLAPMHAAITADASGDPRVLFVHDGLRPGMRYARRYADGWALEYAAGSSGEGEDGYVFLGVPGYFPDIEVDGGGRVHALFTYLNDGPYCIDPGRNAVYRIRDKGVWGPYQILDSDVNDEGECHDRPMIDATLVKDGAGAVHSVTPAPGGIRLTSYDGADVTTCRVPWAGADRAPSLTIDDAGRFHIVSGTTYVSGRCADWTRKDIAGFEQAHRRSMVATPGPDGVPRILLFGLNGENTFAPGLVDLRAASPKLEKIGPAGPLRVMGAMANENGVRLFAVVDRQLVDWMWEDGSFEDQRVVDGEIGESEVWAGNPSVAVDFQGAIYLVYKLADISEESTAPGAFRLAEFRDGEWSVQEVDLFDGSPTSAPSIVVDGDGVPTVGLAVDFDETLDLRIWIGRRTDDIWTTSLVTMTSEALGNTTHPTLAVDGDGSLLLGTYSFADDSINTNLYSNASGEFSPVVGFPEIAEMVLIGDDLDPTVAGDTWRSILVDKSGARHVASGRYASDRSGAWAVSASEDYVAHARLVEHDGTGPLLVGTDGNFSARALMVYKSRVDLALDRIALDEAELVDANHASVLDDNGYLHVFSTVESGIDMMSVALD
ncbi:MAG: hypothetical protein H6683_05410 [Deltaproteobacteria bacterium]|nr:hypothetical protein [Deltaproteobacteria bacterium]MCB9479098.1 hypothetical protein [Deltaproteobacteria bacterium]